LIQEHRTELAVAVGRPKSTIAHHVKVLGEAGLV
jgi:DNA-binding transcriptional ArsR family regulator